MSYFIRIYCRADKPLTRANLAAFIVDGVFFETRPTFSPDDEQALAQREWEEALSVEYAISKRPIIFSRHFGDELVKAEVEEAAERLSQQGIRNATVTEHLRETVQIIAIEVDRDHLTDEA